jgi:hypothetical protein
MSVFIPRNEDRHGFSNYVEFEVGAPPGLRVRERAMRGGE